ncbi:MAG: glucarate dehydratase [Anaerolineae bacterium]|nr:glucarate dehydratase [Anaerolineae bacterium]
MLIDEMIVTPIALIDPPLLNAAGLHAPYALRVIVELHTDNGLYGLGEVPGGQDVAEALTAVRSVVIGSDPFHYNVLHRAIGAKVVQADGPRGDFPWDLRIVTLVRSAVEVACLDLIGKQTERPLVDLLGGKFRDSVPFSAYLFYKYEGAGGALGFGVDKNANGWSAARQAAALDPAGVVAQTKAMVDAFGFQSIKLKGGVFSPDQEVAAMFALRDAFGADVPLRLDPNALWSVETAIKAGRQLDGVLEYYEDPVRGQQAMADVRRAVKLPLATNMCTTSFADMPGSLTLGSEDIILSDHHAWGGVMASVHLAKMCEVFGRGLSMHSNSHAGISLAAMVHLAAAVPNLTYACDTHYPWQSEDVIVGGQIQIKDGAVKVPDKPGLGVELDRAELARLHKQYVDSGLTRRDDAVEMKKVDPTWAFKPTRW